MDLIHWLQLLVLKCGFTTDVERDKGVQQQLIHAMKDKFSTKQLKKASYKAATSDLVEMYGIHLTIEPILDLLEGKCSWIAMTNTAQMTKNRWTE